VLAHAYHRVCLRFDDLSLLHGHLQTRTAPSVHDLEGGPQLQLPVVLEVFHDLLLEIERQTAFEQVMEVGDKPRWPTVC